MAVHIWKSKRIPVRLLTAFLAVAPLSAHAQLRPAATAQGERMVRLRDGSLLRGELVEEIPNHHITLKLATGEVRRIAWADLVESTPLLVSVPLALAAPPELGPAILLRDGSVLRGERVEVVPGDHVTLRLVTGEVRRIAWADVPFRMIPLGDGTQLQCELLATYPGDHITVRLVTGEVRRIPWPALVLRTVRLRDGSQLAGELVEEVPSDHITLKLVPRELRRLAWADLVDYTPLGLPLPPPDPVVHIQSDDPHAQLLHRSRRSSLAEEERWWPVCIGSCDKPVEPYGLYSIGGYGITQSKPFSLGFIGSNARLVVQAGHTGVHTGGLALALLGPLAMLSGFITLAVGLGTNPPPPPPCFPNCASPGSGSSAQPLAISGGVIVGLGAGMTVAGIAMRIKSRTHVAIDGMEIALKAPGGGTRLALGPAGLRF